MIEKKRYSSLIMLLGIGKMIKDYALLALLLFVFNSSSTFTYYGRIILVVIIVWTLLSIVVKWFTHKYELDKESFHLYKGLFSKSVQTVPFSKIQNVNRHASFFHRLLGQTSLHFETAMTGEQSTISFKIISKEEAEKIENYVNHALYAEQLDDLEEIAHLSEEPLEFQEDDMINETTFEQTDEEITREPKKILHFKPTRKDIIKASFTSLSFLVLIPLALSFYVKISELFKVEEMAEGFLKKVIETWWVIALLISVLFIASVAFGMIRTFLKYGNYEMSSDAKMIYISKGVVDETAFSISKEKVQAIEIEQSFMKRILGLAEVKLISTGSTNELPDVRSLYPFLPVQKAYDLISEILPSYEITEKMNALPKKSLAVRMLRPSWFWVIVTGALWYFKPIFLKIEQTWLISSILLLLLILVGRFLDFKHTRYVINEQFIQLQQGAFTTSLFISKREKVSEVSAKRGILQKKLGLATIQTMNRANPVHYTGLNDIPINTAAEFFKWYKDRNQEIVIDDQ